MTSALLFIQAECEYSGCIKPAARSLKMEKSSDVMVKWLGLRRMTPYYLNR